MWRRVVRGLAISCLALLSSAVFAQEFLGRIETPIPGETLSGVAIVRGFAVDLAQISRVDLYVDDVFQHSLRINIPRIDIIQAFPDWEGIQTRLPGFETGFLTTRFSNGVHSLHVVVITGDDRSTEVGRRSFTIDNTINQGPFGFVDIPDGSSIFDVNGSFPVVGWAADTDGIRRVDVQIDNFNEQAAIYGDQRPDVGNAFPDFPQALFSGFVAHIDTTRIPDGVHTLVVRAMDQRGLTKVLNRRNIQIFNNTNNLRPFGYLDEPQRDATLWGTCGGFSLPPLLSPVPIFPATNNISAVRGWALDLGTREDSGRVSHVELLIDGVRWMSTDDCSFNTDLDAYVNCYGITRFDVARYYPFYPDAPRSGYVFAVDVGVLIALGVRPGHHVLKVRVSDQEQTFADIPNTSGIPVVFTCAEDDQDFRSIGYIDFPINMDFLNGLVTFVGWATDNNGGVAQVEIWIDGEFVGLATYGLARPDVSEVHPTAPQASTSGWRFVYDTSQLADQRHRVTVVVVDLAGNRSEIGSVDFFTDNPNQ